MRRRHKGSRHPSAEKAFARMGLRVETRQERIFNTVLLTPLWALGVAVAYAAALLLVFGVMILAAVSDNNTGSQEVLSHYFKLLLAWGAPLAALIGAVLWWADSLTSPVRLRRR